MHLPGETRNPAKTLNQDIRQPSLGLNQTYSE